MTINRKQSIIRAIVCVIVALAGACAVMAFAGTGAHAADIVVTSDLSDIPDGCAGATYILELPGF